jgi:NADH-quinone oxidoreductase subunit D
MRGSNIKKDLRLLGYEIYSIVDLGISMGLLGDCLDRYLIRVNETFTSIKIIQQLFHYVKFSYYHSRHHNINLVMASFSLPCIVMESMIDIFRFIFIAIHGFTYIRQEAPKGELGLYIVSSNRNKIYRIKIRSPDY